MHLVDIINHAVLIKSMQVPRLWGRSTGFSLVELSIVLVILGLLVGGVLSGRSLIRAAELRSITTQHGEIITAVNNFRQKYFYLPGDMPNATAIWGQASTPLANCYNSVRTVIPQIATCNGDGNGRVDGLYEQYMVAQQLGNAGLLVYSTSSQTAVGGLFLPAKMRPQVWALSFQGYAPPGVWPWSFSMEYGHALAMYKIDDYQMFLPPGDLWGIDVKVDDGKPATGKLIAYGDMNSAGLTSCTTATGDVDYSSTYLVNKAGVGCAIIFRQQF